MQLVLLERVGLTDQRVGFAGNGDDITCAQASRRQRIEQRVTSAHAGDDGSILGRPAVLDLGHGESVEGSRQPITADYDRAVRRARGFLRAHAERLLELAADIFQVDAHQPRTDCRQEPHGEQQAEKVGQCVGRGHVVRELLTGVCIKRKSRGRVGGGAERRGVGHGARKETR